MQSIHCQSILSDPVQNYFHLCSTRRTHLILLGLRRTNYEAIRQFSPVSGQFLSLKTRNFPQQPAITHPSAHIPPSKWEFHTHIKQSQGPLYVMLRNNWILFLCWTTQLQKNTGKAFEVKGPFVTEHEKVNTYLTFQLYKNTDWPAVQWLHSTRNLKQEEKYRNIYIYIYIYIYIVDTAQPYNYK
jgi:hypothetical protein